MSSKIPHNVEKFILFNLLKSELRYCNQFQNKNTTALRQSAVCPKVTAVVAAAAADVRQNWICHGAMSRNFTKYFAKIFLKVKIGPSLIF